MTRLMCANQVRAAFRNELLNLVQLKTRADRGVEEYPFHPTRKWRFDLAWPEFLVALEIEGATWVQGRHTRPMGFLGDIEKYNAATMAGWRVLRCVWTRAKNDQWDTPAMDDGTAAGLVVEAIKRVQGGEPQGNLDTDPPIILQGELPFSLSMKQLPMDVPVEFLKGVGVE